MHAELSRREGQHDWACFSAQQAAEMAVNAVHYHLKQEVRGHSILKLLENLPNVPPELADAARYLDKLYIQPRYPNGFSEGAPFEYFSAAESQKAIAHAREILEFGRLQMAE